MLMHRARSLAKPSAGLASRASSRAKHLTRPLSRAAVSKAASFAAKRSFSTPARTADPEFHVVGRAPDAKYKHNVDVKSFLDSEVPALAYNGDASFLSGPTQRTKILAKQVEDLFKAEIAAGGLLDVDVSTPSHVMAFPAGYVDKENEVIVGLQTDAPLKRAIKPWGGVKTVEDALEGYGRKLDPKVKQDFGDWCKTHNQGVFDAYTEEMRKARSSHILTGLPDAYGRGRIIGDYRRVALYGIDHLIAQKKEDLAVNHTVMSDAVIEMREEVSQQIRSLQAIKQLGALYGFDLSKPAANAREAVQWVYFGYLAATREQDGAAMSLGRVDSFLDTYIERDIKAGKLTESGAQELIDQFVLKLRMIKHLRTPAYNDLFAGDPTWVTTLLGGLDVQGNNRVTKTSFRFLQTLYNIGCHPEPNITIAWDENLPKGWKDFCSKVSIETSSLQFENDTLMRKIFGHDYSVACCVSGMETGKSMQYFGARCNMPKLLLYALNGGKDELTGVQVGPATEPVPAGKPLVFEDVKARFEKYMGWMALVYSQTMNTIHHMHDKHNYEGVQMALHDTDVHRYMAFGICGVSIIADALSAIKHAKVTPIFDPEKKVITSFDIQGEFPKFGNNDDKVDKLAVDAVHSFSTKLKTMPLRRNAEATLSLLTITSNVVYGKLTGATPDGRPAGVPFAPGANPMHGRDTNGVIASLASVAKIPYTDCKDGISYTLSMEPHALGRSEESRIESLSNLLDGHFGAGAQHLNVNVLTTEMLREAMDNPDKYPLLTIRVSGYAVRFNRLTKKQQLEVIARTCHSSL